MAEKKSLDLDELKKVAGGVVSEEAKDWSFVNSQIFYDLWQNNREKYDQIRQRIEQLEKEAKIYSKEEFKQILIREFGFKESDFIN